MWLYGRGNRLMGSDGSIRAHLWALLHGPWSSTKAKSEFSKVQLLTLVFWLCLSRLSNWVLISNPHQDRYSDYLPGRWPVVFGRTLSVELLSHHRSVSANLRGQADQQRDGHLGQSTSNLFELVTIYWISMDSMYLNLPFVFPAINAHRGNNVNTVREIVHIDGRSIFWSSICRHPVHPNKYQNKWTILHFLFFRFNFFQLYWKYHQCDRRRPAAGVGIWHNSFSQMVITTSLSNAIGCFGISCF